MDKIMNNGCDLCGYSTVDLRGKCHPTAPLRVEMLGNWLILKCYRPDCNKEVARLKLAIAP